MSFSTVSASAESNILKFPAEKHWWSVYRWGVCRWVLLLLGHMAILTALYSVLYCFDLVQLPTEQVLARWDSGWFQSIRDHGYSYEEGKQSNVAFFPLFPYLWRVTGLQALGISILNLLIWIVGTALLLAALPCTRRQGMLLASVPLLMFTWVPYTEALFYLFGALILVGLHRQHLGLLLLGLLGCCLTRIAATFFLPALCLAELLSWLEARADWKASVKAVVLGTLAMAAAVGSVLWFQHWQTGEWLGFYKAHRHWQHEWRLPTLWLRTSAKTRMQWLDTISLGISLGAIMVCIYLLSSRLWSMRKVMPTKPSSSKAVRFALGYCVCIGIFTVFQQGGDIVGISRYTLGTPFFGVLLWAMWQQRYSWSTWVFGAIVACLVLYFVGFPYEVEGFKAPQAAWYFGLAAAYVVAMLVAGNSKLNKLPFQRELGGAIYLFNTLIQVYMLNWFMSAVWLG
jgi:hypothetical protein